MSATELRRLMRQHRVTIRELARRLDIPMVRVRHLRRTGTTFLGGLDCWQAITGAAELDAPRQAALAYYRATAPGLN